MQSSLTPSRLSRSVFAGIRCHRKPLLAFHFYFAILALGTITPASGWLLAGLIELSGEPMVGNEDLLRFLVQPAGLAWLLASGTLAAVSVYLQHAGMMLIASRDEYNRFNTATVALWRVARSLPRLLQLAGMQVAAHLLAAAPFLALLAWCYDWLLGGYDIYYVINEGPSELGPFLACAALLLVCLVAVNGGLYLRWMFALPLFLLENQKPLQALKRSAALSKGVRLRIALTALTVGGALALAPFLLSLAFDALGAGMVRFLPERLGALVPMMALLLVCYVLLGVALAFIAVSANSLMILKLYRARSGGSVELPRPNEIRQTGILAIGIEAAVVILALVQLAIAIRAYDSPGPVAITAHRGSSFAAPENTLAAIERALRDGADFVELDVRQTADGELVLLHDRDLLRMAGDPRSVWELDAAELRAIDVGRRFGSAFEGERVPTLKEAIAALRGRAQLYLEIKPSPRSPDLTRQVIATLREQDFVEQTIVAALSPAVLHEARRRAPGIRTSLLVHSSIGSLDRQPFEIFALRDALATPRLAKRLHQRGRQLHVWTVNDARAMRRFIDMGVDSIITDRPELLAEMVEEWEQLSAAERLLVRMRNWMWRN